jgi:hypothetical protein
LPALPGDVTGVLVHLVSARHGYPGHDRCLDRPSRASLVGHASYRSTQAAKPYCDVEEAFDKELHLGATGGNGGPGDTD